MGVTKTDLPPFPKNLASKGFHTIFPKTTPWYLKYKQETISKAMGRVYDGMARVVPQITIFIKPESSHCLIIAAGMTELLDENLSTMSHLKTPISHS
jgi:hypothetical protein